jgi:hypothetical protein
MAQSLADELQAARQMAVALAANQADVSTRGGGVEFVAAGQAQVAQLEILNVEQEALKAALKAKTTEVETALKGLRGWRSEAIKIVKLAYRTEQDKWVEFGITASR